MYIHFNIDINILSNYLYLVKSIVENNSAYDRKVSKNIIHIGHIYPAKISFVKNTKYGDAADRLRGIPIFNSILYI